MPMNNDENKRDMLDQMITDKKPETLTPQNRLIPDNDEEEINDPNFYDGFEFSRDVYFAQRNVLHSFSMMEKSE